MSEIATFAAGCFWGVEAAFRRVPGVLDAVSGYSGGRTENPSYKDVCTDHTGHAEVVQVAFDPSKVSYEQLLDVFWKIHDPTQVNRQGPDFLAQCTALLVPIRAAAIDRIVGIRARVAQAHAPSTTAADRNSL